MRLQLTSTCQAVISRKPNAYGTKIQWKVTPPPVARAKIATALVCVLEEAYRERGSVPSRDMLFTIETGCQSVPHHWFFFVFFLP